MKNSSAVKNSKTRLLALDRGRTSFRNRAWSEAFSQLSVADGEAPLDPEDLEAISIAAHLTGKQTLSVDLLARAHQGFVSRGEIQRAARSAFWLGFIALVGGEPAKAGGWLARAERLLQGQPDCVERGYLLLPTGFRSVHGGDPVEAFAAFAGAVTIAERFGDTDLLTLARQGQGRALIRQGEVARGVSLLDEAMVAVIAGEVSPIVAGGVYCSLIDACGEIFDLRRAQEWTSALEQWCASQPDMVPYRGLCMIRRAEIFQLHGAWQDAFQEAQEACEQFSQPTPRPEAGNAFYRLAEVHRVRGQFEEAEEAYRQASLWRRLPQPGLAQLRFAQGQRDAAIAAIRRLSEEVTEPAARAAVLDAFVEIVLADKDLPAAREAADELAKLAGRFDAQLLHAMADRADGFVLLAGNDARRGLVALRKSWATWCALQAPYEIARTQALIGLACRALGDEDAAKLEMQAAREAFRTLGAAPDLARVTALLEGKLAEVEGPLTAREMQVLKFVASGQTNRVIASKLGISEKTVARHISNIFNKLDLSSRAAATAYAYQHELVS